jgi:hypothetical protein
MENPGSFRGYKESHLELSEMEARRDWETELLEWQRECWLDIDDTCLQLEGGEADYEI